MSNTLTSISNLYSMNILGSMNKAQSSLGTAIKRLSSGEAVGSSFDSPSGFAISEKMRSYIMDLKKSSSNAQNGISYLQTAEGASNEITSMLQRMRELSVEASNGIYTSGDRQELQNEMNQLKAEIDRISDSTEFNTKKLLSGETTGAWDSGTNRISALITGPVADGNYDISLNVTPGKNQIDTSQIMTIKNGKLGAQVNNGGSSNITSVKDPNNVTVTNGRDFQVTVADRITSGDTANLITSYKQNNGIFSTGPIGTAISTNQSGYMEIEFIETSDTANLAGTRYRMRFISAESGVEGQWVEFASVVNDSLSGTYTANGVNVSFQIPITTSASSTVTEGDKLLFAVSDNRDMATADELLVSGGGTVQITQGGVTGPFVTYGKNALTKPDNKDGINDVNDVTLYTIEMDPKTGEIKKGSFTVGFKENASAGATLSGTATIEVRGGGSPATATTKLSDLANFIDADGNDLLASAQELVLLGNSNSVSLYIDKNDTMDSLRNKLMKAIAKDLQMGSNDVSVDNRIAEYINNGGAGFKTVPGTLLIQSGITGDAGKISFAGNQKLLDALGFQTVQKAENNITEVTIKNNRTGEIAGSGTTSDGKLKNVIEGLDIAFDSRASVEARWNNTTGTIEFLKSERLENFNMNLHIVDARTKVQIGARKGENMDVSIPQINTKSLGIENTSLSTQEDAQKAITQVDAALSKVTSVRSEMGAKVNRLERAISNISTMVVNVTESDSRIRDADVAAETSNMAMAQLMYQTNIAMMAQANQIPGMALSLITQR